MKKVLIATTNNDKYNTVARIFKKTIFPENDYIIEKLNDKMNLPEEKEQGSNIDRARTKAQNAFKYLKNYNYDYIVGLDDAIYIKGELKPNIKDYLNKILFDNYLKENEEYAFNRAYCIIDQNHNIFETNATIPYIYKPLNKNIKLEDHTYPLSKVSYPIGYNKPICDLNDEDEINYYLYYVKDEIIKLNINNTN